jgi:osmoprotectant transport system permease protein
MTVAAPPKGPVIPNFGQGSSCETGDHAFCWDWVRGHWGDTLQPALVQHVELTAIAVGIGFAIAFTLALAAHRMRRIEQPVSVVSALLYTIPSLALFQLLVPFTGITTTTVEIALVSYTLVILFPNIVAGLHAAPDDVLEAARGMGLTRRQVLTRVELPLALPLLFAGIRIAAIFVIATATIAAIAGGGGLGEIIVNQASYRLSGVVAASLCVSALAFSTAVLLTLARRALSPRVGAAG